MAHGGFWRKLKRRHVYRVAAACAVVGWLLIPLATRVFPIFQLPGGIDQAVVLPILPGFPIALARAFDATPHGIARTEAEHDADSRAARRSPRIGSAVGLIGMLLAVGAGAAWWHVQRGSILVADGAHATSTQAASAVAPMTRRSASVSVTAVFAPASRAAAYPSISGKSVAVLPFADEGENRDQQHFPDGLSEELITALAQFAGLQAINRESSFQFRDSEGAAVNDSAPGFFAQLKQGKPTIRVSRRC